MQYEFYLKYDGIIDLTLNARWGNLWEYTWADIMCWTNTEDDNEDEVEHEDLKIGILVWATYNQALAMAHSVTMSDVSIVNLQYNSEALLALDCSLINKETIDEIGAASNPNIVTLMHYGISADWRNKGIGEQVLKGFIEQMKGKFGYIVIVHNVPAQFGKNGNADGLYAKQGIELDSLEKDPEKAQWKLNAFWQRCGFKQFKGYDNVFICNVDQAVADRRRANAPAI